jgi:hypothetical protein
MADTIFTYLWIQNFSYETLRPMEIFRYSHLAFRISSFESEKLINFINLNVTKNFSCLTLASTDLIQYTMK